ncbi:MAG: glycerol-3-phosphate dehydrogenase/oxidase [Rhodothermales bacterium]
MKESLSFKRDELVSVVTNRSRPWDVLVIGGGATGLGAAVDAASRGYDTLLLEQSDFGKGTSSRSTKLVHGGVRYLQQGNLSLVYEALHERGLLLENAPHVTTNLNFVIPCYRWWEKPFYATGLKLYDLMAGKRSLGGSRVLSARGAREHLPTVRSKGLRGGVRYQDGQFDDARLALNLAQTAVEQGGVALNYVRVDALEKEGGRISGVVATDLETGSEWTISARAVVNATGVFGDTIRRMDRPDAKPMIQPSQGAHIVVDRSFLPGDSALMLPKTDDGRVLFAVPWHERVIIGTTDTPLDDVTLEPRALEDEVTFLVEHADRYLDRPLGRADVLSVFAGLRPLVSTEDDEETAAISRDHVLCVSHSGLITITGGKWTTYRRMGEDTIDKAAELAGLAAQPCRTHSLRIHGWVASVDRDAAYSIYGADAEGVEQVVRSTETGPELVHDDLSVRAGEVRWMARREMARTVDDVLARRTRSLLLDARASAEAAPAVAALLADELGKDADWADDQAASFQEMAKSYILDAPGAGPATPARTRANS